MSLFLLPDPSADPAGEVVDPEAWRADAACVDVDPDLFFPTVGESLVEAKRVCASCTVRSECFRVGVFERFGVWAGLSEQERRTLRRKLRKGLTTLDVLPPINFNRGTNVRYLDPAEDPS